MVLAFIDTLSGGTNPAIRTLFYRLVRLLATPIQPVFVFDGPEKPRIKRNKRSGRGDGVATALAKRLIRLFGFPVHDAPGEAEAECALLQRHGLVDAVLSEDVDTIMFGCTKTLRNWSSEGKNAKTPTHVSLYDVQDLAVDELGLDREGMVLIALMSGGDYLPDGIPGCGVKVACEAAKAGFGRSVCRLKASDEDGIRLWRNGLIHELHTNEKGLFRTKHKALTVPSDFPNLEVLRYYTHPKVSPESAIPAIRQRVEQRTRLHLEDLREFTREIFDWDYRIGAVKFVRVMSQALLVNDIAAEHIKRISGRRTHFSTDGTPELRVAFVPEEVVPIDLSKEVDEVATYGRSGLALNSDDEFDVPADAALPGSVPKMYDVKKPDLAWILEGWVQKSAPGALLEWQERESAKMVRQSPKKKRATKASKPSDMPHGSIDKFFRTTKPSSTAPTGPVIAKQLPGPPRARGDALSSSPTRAAARSTSPSKQARSSQSPNRTPALQVIDGSPVAPRFRRAEEPEAIYISSSPPAQHPSPLQRPTGISAAPASGEIPRPLQSTARQGSSQVRAPDAPSPSRLKQSSLDLFVTKPLSAAAARKQSLCWDYSDRDSDLEPLAALAAARPSDKAPDRHGVSPAVGDAPRRRGQSRAGSHQTTRAEVHSAGVEPRPVSGDRERRGPRWSDVSVIDLT